MTFSTSSPEAQGQFHPNLVHVQSILKKSRGDNNTQWIFPNCWYLWIFFWIKFRYSCIKCFHYYCGSTLSEEMVLNASKLDLSFLSIERIIGSILFSRESRKLRIRFLDGFGLGSSMRLLCKFKPLWHILAWIFILRWLLTPVNLLILSNLVMIWPLMRFHLGGGGGQVIQSCIKHSII